MTREYQPGDVAMVTAEWRRGEATTATAARRKTGWERLADGAFVYDVGDSPRAVVRSLVVIDPEDREQIEAAASALTAALINVPGGGFMRANTVQAALRSLIKPPKPEVYAHLAIAGNGSAQSLCGKVWVPSEDVTVVGRCPECDDLAENGSGWIA